MPTLIMESSPKFITCPDCGERYDNARKRRLIDTCGHPRCYSCLFVDKPCPLCESKYSNPSTPLSRQKIYIILTNTYKKCELESVIEILRIKALNNWEIFTVFSILYFSCIIMLLLSQPTQCFGTSLSSISGAGKFLKHVLFFECSHKEWRCV